MQKDLMDDTRQWISLTIDGCKVVTLEGTTILEAAKKINIEIPHLCYLPGKDEPRRPCLLCTVEVKGKGLLRACSTLVEEGMVVIAHSEELKRFRRERLEFLAKIHYGDCKAPCNLACPAGINVQGYIRLISFGEYEAALRLIKEKNPFPLSVGRVCPRFCETRCRRILLDEPISINHLKRFVADYIEAKGGLKESPGKPIGKRVAIIGGGPAGLSCAYYLRKLGIDVTIFETAEALGGMLRFGIPPYKLPQEIVDQEIKNILALGVQVKLGQTWGKDFTLEDLRVSGFEAIFIAIGLLKQKLLKIKGKEYAIDGLKFLREINCGKHPRLGSKVLIIGGGNIALDAARCAKRLGSEEITIVYERSRVEMAAPQREIKEAEEEGINFFFMATPLSIEKSPSGKIRVTLARTILSPPDNKGRRRPIPISKSLLFWEGDTVITALGQEVDDHILSFGKLESKLLLTPKKTIKVNPTTMATNIPGIYAGGDCVTGPRTVIQAISAGRRAAEAIYAYLLGRKIKSSDRFNFSRGKRLEEVDPRNYEGMALCLRESMPSRPSRERIKDFKEITLGYTEEMARREASRCLQCGCLGLSKCVFRKLAKDHRLDTQKTSSHLLYPLKHDHPSIYIDPNKCVLCFRCERSCKFEAIKIFFTEKEGEILEKNILIEMEKCTSCGTCVDSCPTGALVKKNLLLPLLPGETKITKSVCPYCGVGCKIEIHTKHNSIVEIKADFHKPPNYGELCVKGRFGFEFQRHPTRLKHPLIRKTLSESFRKVSWEEALDFVAKRLAIYQGDVFAALSSAKCSTEENYVFQKFVRVVMKTNNIDHCARLCHSPSLSALKETLGSGVMTNSISEIGESACIFAIGTNTPENHPVIFLQIKKALEKGAKLIVADPRKTELCKYAHIWLKHRPGTDIALIMGIARVICDRELLDKEFIKEQCENFKAFRACLAHFELERVSQVTGVTPDNIIKAANLFAKNHPACILYGMGITQHTHGTDNVLALSNLVLLTGNIGKPSTGIYPLRGQNNVQGACDMGALPDLFPGYQKVTDPSAKRKFEKAWRCKLSDRPGLPSTKMFEAISHGIIKAMYIIGENPVLSHPDAKHIKESLKKLELLIVQDIFLTETARFAHVVLPAACSYEKEGTFTNTERRIQRIRKALDPPGDAKADWEIICNIAKKMGAQGFNFAHPSEIMKEISQVVPPYGGITYERLEKEEIQWPCPTLNHPGTKYLYAQGFPRGKARFVPLEYKGPFESPDDKYPFILITGRTLFHYHTGTMTRKCSVLNRLQNEEWIELNPYDAKALNIKNKDLVIVSSRRGCIYAKAKLSKRVPQGIAFMSFHFAETPTNEITNPAQDPVAKISELKICAVSIKRL